MVSSADRKNWSFSLPAFSRKGACHVALFPQNRTSDEDVLPLSPREGSTSLCRSRNRQAGLRRHRVHFHALGLRSQDHPPRHGRSCRVARCATRTVPKKRGGRKRLIDTDPQLQTNFQKVLQDHTAGDPMKPDVLWTNLSLSAIAERMGELGTPVGPSIVEQLLGEAHLGRRQAFKTVAMGPTPDRNQQFEIISFYKEFYFDSLNPILSIDTKKRELMGLFYRDGRLFSTQTMRVYDHDFPSFAEGHVIPHGLYDLKRNRGYINLGVSYDTSEFACDSIFQWWTAEGHAAWPQAKSLLLLCDGGGSNSAKQYLFKQDLQGLANRMGLEIRVAHYRPYTSKYNPI